MYWSNWHKPALELFLVTTKNIKNVIQIAQYPWDLHWQCSTVGGHILPCQMLSQAMQKKTCQSTDGLVNRTEKWGTAEEKSPLRLACLIHNWKRRPPGLTAWQGKWLIVEHGHVIVYNACIISAITVSMCVCASELLMHDSLERWHTLSHYENHLPKKCARSVTKKMRKKVLTSSPGENLITKPLTLPIPLLQECLCQSARANTKQCC